MVLTILKPKPISLWLEPIEFGVAATMLMWFVTLIVVRQNNRLLRELVDIHRLK
jgi:hypothetical protein